MKASATPIPQEEEQQQPIAVQQQQQMKITVLAISSLQVLLLVIVGTTGFILSIVSNLVPTRFKTGQKLVPVARRRASSPPSSFSSSSSTSTRRSSSVIKQSRPKLVKRDSDSLPDLVHDNTSDDESPEPSIASTESATLTSSTNSSSRKVGGKHVQLQEPLHPSSSSAMAKQCPLSSQQPRRTSMDVVRHTLHIPPRSPPCSRPSSVTSPDKGDKAHTHCPRPMIGRLFSSSSSREASPPLSEAEGSESGLVSSEEKRPPLPQRKMSLKIGSSFRSRGRRTVSEVNTCDATLLRNDSTVSSLASPPVSPTGPSHSSTLSNLRNFLGSPNGKPKARRAASEQVIAPVAPAPMSRHELMAEARRYRDREARLYAAAHSPSSKGRETPLDMSGKSQLTMAEHFA